MWGPAVREQDREDNSPLMSIENLDTIYTVLRFGWDETKNKRNRSKHGVWFEEAQSVFDDPRSRVFHDSEHSDEEDRFLIVGMSSAARILVVVHCHRETDSLIRIISARKATKREVKFYEKGI